MLFPKLTLHMEDNSQGFALGGILELHPQIVITTIFSQRKW